MSSYKELEVWKKSRMIVLEIYSLSAGFPQSELHGITNQLRRASVSIPSNIAEGHGRNYSKETIQFLHISRGSLFEVDTLLGLAIDIGYVTEKETFNLNQHILECIKMINGLIKYFETRK